MPRPLSPHGSKGAYERHKRAHDRVCDACQAWKDAEMADRAVVKSRSHTQRALEKAGITDPDTSDTTDAPKARREVDPIVETLDNLDMIERAMDLVADSAPERLGALSKRRSELIQELVEYGGTVESEKKPEVDPLEIALGGGIDLSNVTRIAG